MRLLTVSGLFHPHILGGAENSAVNLAIWLAAHGDDVNVLSAAESSSDECSGEEWKGVKLWRRYFPRPYPVTNFPRESRWKKPLWHLQDMFDPRNQSIVGKVLDEIKPDAALVHFIPGIGFNALKELARRDIPATYYLHDLGLACVRMSMFKSGRDCAKQCLMCKATSKYKQSILNGFARIGFCSPSNANLVHVQKFVTLAPRACTAIPNANHYPSPTVLRQQSPHVRFLYAGRLHPQKGVLLVLDVLRELALRFKFTMRVVGGGQSEAELRTQFGSQSWCVFTGHVSQTDVADEMANADVLLVPSVWLENSPGVVIQALALGLPVIGSDKGGIPELIDNNVSGLLLQAGDRPSWRAALESVLQQPDILRQWRESASRRAIEFERDALGAKHRQFIGDVVGIKG